MIHGIRMGFLFLNLDMDYYMMLHSSFNTKIYGVIKDDQWRLFKPNLDLVQYQPLDQNC